MPVTTLMKQLFRSPNDELTGFVRREERKFRRTPHTADHEFSPELERLRYEILRTSV